MSDTQQPAPPAAGAKGKVTVAAPTPALTPAALTAEQMVFARKLAADDAARDKADTVTMVAIAAFTLVVDDLDKYPDGKPVRAGEDFEVSAFDVPRFTGRGRLKVLDDPNRAGVTANRE